MFKIQKLFNFITIILNLKFLKPFEFVMEDFKIVFGYKAKLWALAVVIAYIYIMRLQMTRHTRLWEDLAEKNMSL